MTGVDPELSRAWTQHGVRLADLEARSDGTLLASERRRLEETVTLASSPGVELERDVALSPERLALGAVLGRGGMGEVRVAEQLGLRRVVAVKTSLHRDDAAAKGVLLKEAWVGACLEHPNVVPVHTLARTDAGPAIVMKKVVGTSLAEHRRDVGSVGEPSPRTSMLGGRESHDHGLRVMIQVAHAVSFAHARGILHLDLKAENVMLGLHGEVYVVDWGLAVSDGARGPSWLLPASSIRSIAGTPTHMAPELASADGARIGPRTDVYLLGAMLHRIVTGRVLHDGADLEEILVQAWRSPPPEFPPEVPEELAAIIRRAVARDPEERYPDAASFRDALEDHLRDRHADRLALLARRALSDADELLARRGSDAEIAQQLAEAEIAIEQVHRDRPDRADVEELVDALLLRRARQAVLGERPAAARALVGRRRAPPPADVLAEIARAEARLADREAHMLRLEELRRELDLTLGNTERRTVFAVLGAAWMVVCLFFGWGARTGRFVMGYRELLLEGAILVGVLVPYGVARRRTYFANLANQRVYGGLIVAGLTVELFWVAASWLGLPVQSAIALTPSFYVYAFATLGLVLDRRMGLGALALAVAAVAAALAPAYAHDAIGLGGGAAVFAVLASAGARPARA